MKKKILLFIISFFFFIPDAFALSKVNSINVNVNIDENGMATVTEEWHILSQSNKYFEKEFYDVKNATISDYTVTAPNFLEYEYVDKIDKDLSYQYNFKDKKGKKKIAFTTDGKEKTIVIKYNVKGMISQFDDVQGINWYFLSNSSKQEVGTLNIYISGPIAFNENNTILYGIGKDLSLSFSEGKIHIFAININSKTKIKLMTSFNDITFSNTNKVNGTLVENYNKLANRSPMFNEMIEIVTSETAIILITLSIFIIVFIIVAKIINNIKNKNNYKDIYSYNRLNHIGDVNSVPYYDSIPCNGNLFKIEFYANYYKIVKNRSNLIGAIMLKWILEGKAELLNSNDKYSIRLTENLTFENKHEMDLYVMLVEASNNSTLDSNKISRYISFNYEKIINWYEDIVKSSIKEEYDKRNIIVKKKFGKTKIILNKIIYDEAVKIQGLKRYLLNFNQVPRKTELNEEVYKYLILMSIILGVDESFSREILRKNPDNIMATKLLEYEKIKSIYKNIYNQVTEEYRKHKHKKEKNIYDPTIRDNK